jgi:hypothetical protein
LGLPFPVESLSAKGVATPTEFEASELNARLFDGSARGVGTLRWDNPMLFIGRFDLNQVDAKRLAPILTGQLQGSAVVAAQAEALEKLCAGARLEGNFSVQRGQIVGVDLARTLQTGKNAGGSTNFSELSARAQFEKGRLSLRSMKLEGGAFSANGTVDVEGSKSLAGKISADLKTPGGQVRSTLVVSGTPAQLTLKR